MQTEAIAYPSCQPMVSVCKTGGEKQSGLQDHPPLLTVVCMSSSLYTSLFACGGEFYLTILGNPLSCIACILLWLCGEGVGRELKGGGSIGNSGKHLMEICSFKQ